MPQDIRDALDRLHVNVGVADKAVEELHRAIDNSGIAPALKTEFLSKITVIEEALAKVPSKDDFPDEV